MRTFFPSAGGFEREQRLLSFKGINDIPEVQQEVTTDYADWKKQTPGAPELLDHFASFRKIEISDLQTYVAGLASIPLGGTIQKEISDVLTAYNNPLSNTIRSNAELTLEKLAAFILSRNQLVKNTRSDLRNLDTAPPEVPSGIEKVTNGVKDVLGACVDGFSNASGKEQIVMLAGVVAGYLVIRNLLTSAGGMFPKTTKFAKNALGLAVGGSVAYLALQAVNKAVEKTSGRPLIDHNWLGGVDTGFPAFPFFTKTQEEWDAQRYAEVIEKTADEMEKGPKQVLEDIFVKEGIDDVAKAKALGITPENFERRRKGSVAAIMNFSTMSVEKFSTLYTTTSAEESIEDRDTLYPRRPFEKDGLTTFERFQLLLQVGKAAGLIDASGSLLPRDPKRKDEKMLVLMLSF